MNLRLIECDSCGCTLASPADPCDCEGGERSIQAITPLGVIPLGSGPLEPEQVVQVVQVVQAPRVAA
jgi:hypothetical protein